MNTSDMKLLRILCLGVILTLASGVAFCQDGLIGYWPLGETDGDTAVDLSGSGNNGTLANGVEWRPGEGLFGGAMFVDPGDASGYCEIATTGMKVTEGTVMIWGKMVDPQPSRTSYFMGHTTQPVWTNRIQIYTDSADNQLDLGLGDSHTRHTNIIDLAVETWYHIALTWENGAYAVYIDGEEAASGAYTGLSTFYPIMDVGNDGHDQRTRAEAFGGWLAEMKIFNRALEQAEVVKAMIPSLELAGDPAPDDGATDIARSTQLGWSAGQFASTHNVYLGTALADVNEASIDDPRGVLVSERQAATGYDPGRFDFGTTYYWRVDEVNSAPDFAIYKGSVWSFTTEPFSIPISDVTATASSSFGVSVPANTVNGSGLADDLHGTSANDMWISTAIPATLEYSFDRVYKLHEMWVWNSNQLVEPFVGFGAKDVVIEHSLDGANWTTLDGVAPLAGAAGAEGYAHNNTIDFGGAVAQHVRMTINSVQGFAPQASLSEVRFFYIPTLATRPNPESGAGGVAADVTLAWGRDGREAERHDVYFGTDPGNLPLAGTVTESGLDTGGLGLVLGETYHWRVDEVNDTEDPSVWEGNLWNFSTVDRIVVDDMESYADQEFLEIWATWVDGFEDPSNGSLVGNGGAGLPETTITHGGGQSLPIHYDNSGAGLSEATRTFSPAQDWTVGAPETLVVHFQGTLANSGGGQVYAKINNTKVTYDANPAAISSPFWTQWNIDLAGVGMVNSLTIGVEGAGAQGVLFVDDLILYRQAPEAVGAQDPGTANLVAYYPLDNNAQDGTGNGHNGTIEGSPIYVSPGWDGTGACMQFGPQDARITVESFDVAGSGITLSAWINPSLFTNDARMVSKSDGGSTANHYWAMVLSGSGENFLQFRLRTDQGNTTSHTSGGQVQADEWAHVAVTWDASDPVMREYINANQVGSTDKAGTAVATGAGVKIGIGNQSISALAQGPGNEIRPFDGRIDEVRVYSRGLSVSELIHVAFGQ